MVGSSSLFDSPRKESAPISQVALLRSYVNLAAIMGRSLGAPVGGLLFDLIGWRW